MTSPRNKMLIVIIAVLLVSNLISLGFIFFGKKCNEKKNAERGKPMSDFFEKQLNFTPEQTAQFHQLRDQHFDNLKPFLKDVRKAKDSLFSLMHEPNVTDSMVKILAENLAEKEKAQELQSFNHFKKVRELCTEEQKPKFDTLISKLINKTFTRQPVKSDSTRGK